MSTDGTGMTPPPNNEASGAVTSDKPAKKYPSQGKLRSGVMNQRAAVKIDTNKHGIRRETTIKPNTRKTKPKKV